MSVQPISIVVRLADVEIERSQLERSLGFVVDRYELARGHATAYAQIDIPEANDYWSAAFDRIRRMAPILSQFATNKSVGSMCLDVAIAFPDDVMSTSSVVPSSLAELAGGLGMDIELSIYRTASR
jgi:hypothetical protein